MKQKNMIMNRPLNNILNDIERDLLFQIITNLREGNLSVARSQTLAHDFLEIMNIKTKKQLFKELKTLAISYKEAHEVYMKYRTYYINEMRNSTVKRVSHAIEEKNIERAITLVKGGVSV